MSKQSMLCLLWLLFGVVLCLASCITHDGVSASTNTIGDAGSANLRDRRPVGPQ